jgi:hypothetical protein
MRCRTGLVPLAFSLWTAFPMGALGEVHRDAWRGAYSAHHEMGLAEPNVGTRIRDNKYYQLRVDETDDRYAPSAGLERPEVSDDRGPNWSSYQRPLPDAAPVTSYKSRLSDAERSWDDEARRLFEEP